MDTQYGALLKIEDIKASDSGWEVSGYASTFGNVDHGGDVIEPGAFADSIKAWQSGAKKVRFLYGHRTDQVLGVPVEMHEDSKGLFTRAKISKTTLGADVHTLLKDGAVDSLSIGYIPDSFEFEDSGNVRRLKSIDLLEWSVVAIPMNDQAQVTAVKAQLDTKKAIASHSTDTSMDSWDGPMMQSRLSNDAGASTYRRAAAWVDPNKDPDTKAAYRFWHHFVSADGKVGAASTVACSTGIGVLNGGRGGTTIPSEDKRGVYNHLAKHLRDAGKEPPDMKAHLLEHLLELDEDVPFEDLFDQIKQHLSIGVEAAEALHARRAEAQRKLAAAHVEAIESMLAEAKAVGDRLMRLIQEPEAKAEGDLSLRLDLARRLLRRRGISLEIA